MLRTDFTDDAAWTSLCAAIQSPQTEDDFVAYVECVSDPEFSGVIPDQLVALNSGHTFIFVVDSMAVSDPDHPVLVVDLYHNPGRTFRVVPSEMWGVENNLSLANMDFDDFANNTDARGVFRGFPA
ncbi:DUF6924 domain-containing protein [Fuerstiella marisgermanici]|uniref:DUF6924 domain-containing protein n=1 Tax=Fuerstiella marisgermanici TaxID=1891926 RepID=A0A1P8WK91_9PLAN|nr:hypothetical protein [Fuerstiella marisgermanici]APZ94487.1 hypothetical protein Fuma_04119 [Fuerstiella marisgermanici]